MMDRDKLQEAVDSKWVDVYATSYEDVKDQLKDQYKASGWIGAMAQRISGSPTRSGKEYLAVRRSIERHEKEGRALKKYGREMEKVGKTLEPIGKKLPGDSLTLTVKGTQRMGKHGGRRERSFAATLKGPAAYDFAANPSYASFFDAMDYPEDLVNMFDDGDYELEISSVA